MGWSKPRVGAEVLVLGWAEGGGFRAVSRACLMRSAWEVARMVVIGAGLLVGGRAVGAAAVVVLVVFLVETVVQTVGGGAEDVDGSELPAVILVVVAGAAEAGRGAAGLMVEGGAAAAATIDTDVAGVASVVAAVEVPAAPARRFAARAMFFLAALLSGMPSGFGRGGAGSGFLSVLPSSKPTLTWTSRSKELVEEAGLCTGFTCFVNESLVAEGVEEEDAPPEDGGRAVGVLGGRLFPFPSVRMSPATEVGVDGGGYPAFPLGNGRDLVSAGRLPGFPGAAGLLLGFRFDWTTVQLSEPVSVGAADAADFADGVGLGSTVLFADFAGGVVGGSTLLCVLGAEAGLGVSGRR